VISGGPPAELCARALRLATADWVHPNRVREALAARIRLGEEPTVETLLDDLETPADRDRALPEPDETQRTARRLTALGARLVLAGWPGYPPTLLQAWPDLGAPPWLFVHSSHDQVPAGPAVAVVGTRRPTADGIRTAHDLARLLVRHGVVVVSGLARGIDQAAHRGAIDGDGRTVAVLGTGLGVDYPAGSASLRRAVADLGGLITEYAPGTPARPEHFLWRNRIIAGLADATVVVEGRARSGALQTARLAAAQGREVLAVPGSLNQPTARAPLDLIRDGARPVTRLDDVLDAVGIVPGQPRLPITRQGAAGDGARDEPGDGAPLDRDVAAVLELLGAVPVTADLLSARAGLTVAAVLAAVGDLVALGLAAASPRGIIRL
jgi:DNA processing protein